MTISQIIHRRREALLRGFCNIGEQPVLVSVPSMATLGQLSFLDEFEKDEPHVQVGRRQLRNAVIRKGPGDKDSATSLWVRAGYGDYAAAYRAFVRQVYGIAVSSNDMRPYNIDHLLNRRRSATGDAFLRIEAIPAASNQLWGSVYEGPSSADGLPKNEQGFRYLSHTVAAKVAGLTPPSGPDDTGAIELIRAEFRRRGMPDWAMKDALERMLDRDMHPR